MSTSALCFSPSLVSGVRLWAAEVELRSAVRGSVILLATAVTVMFVQVKVDLCSALINLGLGFDFNSL